MHTREALHWSSRKWRDYPKGRRGCPKYRRSKFTILL